MSTSTMQSRDVHARCDAPLAPTPDLAADPLDMRAAEPSDVARLLSMSAQVLSTPRSHFALVLALSRLKPPLPRPHHRRIAAAILSEAARAHPGETFDLPSGDLVLLCRVTANSDADLQPLALREVFARLFAVDVPDAAELTTVWDLERDGPTLLAYTGALEA